MAIGLDTGELLRAFGKMGLSYVLALPIGWEGEREHHAVGLRTFPIVAMASCGFVLLTAGGAMQGDTAALSRVVQGVIMGIGFIGGGAILKEGSTVKGTATAASVWNTGAIGAAVAMGHTEIAIVLSVLNFATLLVLLPLKRKLDRSDRKAD